MALTSDKETQGVSTQEAVQQLLDRVAQLEADKTDLLNRVETQAGPPQEVSAQMLDPAAVALVTPFSGKTGEDVNSFFNDLETAAEISGWSKRQMLQVAKMRLVGEAKTHVLYHEHLRNANTFEEFQTGLIKRYKGQNSCRFYREQLAVLRQRTNEPLDVFADRVRKLNVNTYDLTGHDETNKVILHEAEQRGLDAFLHGLQP